MSGRLRVKWASVHSDEVYFRDTAHGFLAWAVASLATAVLLTGAIGIVISGGAKVAGAAVATAGATGVRAGIGGPIGMNDSSGASGYFIDTLFRPAPPNSGAAAAPADASTAVTATPAGNNMINPGNIAPDPAQRAEVIRIFANALRNGGLSNPDKTYVAQVLAKRNGMNQADAEKRVNDTYTAYSKAIADAEYNAKATAGKARKAAAYASLWMFVALLCGAFVASLCATFGGRMRDRVILVNTVSGASSSTATTI
jgi:hypothetical protein